MLWRKTTPDRPLLVGGDTPEFSTSGALLLRRPHVWDVNGYYRALGVDPYATKLELREAYTARGGPDSPRLTYILKQLLQDDVRAAYDATPLGAVFFDAVIEASVKRRIAEETARLRAEMGDRLPEPEDPLDLEHLVGKAFQLVDRKARSEEDGTGSNEWAWYEWKVSTATYSPRLVKRWRHLLVTVAQECGLVARMAVGIFDWPPEPPTPPVFVTPVGYRLVAFLHHAHEPSEHDAVEALHQVLDHRGAQSHPAQEIKK